MPLNTAALNVGANAIAAAAQYVSLHSADPGANGANEISGGSPAYARVKPTYGAAANGAAVGSQVALNVPAGTTVTHYGLWSALTGGTFYGGFPLPAVDQFGNAGQEQVTPTISNVVV